MKAILQHTISGLLLHSPVQYLFVIGLTSCLQLTVYSCSESWCMFWICCNCSQPSVIHSWLSLSISSSLLAISLPLIPIYSMLLICTCSLMVAFFGGALLAQDCNMILMWIWWVSCSAFNFLIVYFLFVAFFVILVSWPNTVWTKHIL